MLKIVLMIACILAVLFVLSLVVFFFNLDMKMAAKMGTLLNGTGWTDDETLRCID